MSLNSQRNALTLATDVAIAALDRQMQAVENQGEDPSRLDAGDGSLIDLRAARQTLVAERDQELNRLAAIDAELTALRDAALKERARAAGSTLHFAARRMPAVNAASTTSLRRWRE